MMVLLSLSQFKAKAAVLREMAIAMSQSAERRELLDAARRCDRLVTELKRRWSVD